MHRPAVSNASKRIGVPSALRRCTVRGFALLTLLFGTGLLSTSEARADVIWMCGHEIRTSYDQGWVIVDSVSGVNWNSQRPDIKVYGMMRNIDRGEFYETTALAAIYSRVRWGWMQSRIKIEGHPSCDVVLH